MSATSAEVSLKSRKKEAVSTGLKYTLKALNDFYIVEEEPIELTNDRDSGLTKDVVDSLKSGLLVLPDSAEYFANKFPFRGRVIAKGDRTRYDIPIGTRVMFARLGGQRWQDGDKQYLTLREQDIHAIID